MNDYFDNNIKNLCKLRVTFIKIFWSPFKYNEMKIKYVNSKSQRFLFIYIL